MYDNCRIDACRYTVFPQIESPWLKFFSHRLEMWLLFKGGFYSRAAAINASKLPIAIIINTGIFASHHKPHLWKHESPDISLAVCHHDNVTGSVPS